MTTETAPLSAVRVEPVVRFKEYVVMAHHIEGWNVVAESDSFQEAVKEREYWMGMGYFKVRIFRPVDIIVTESNNNSAPEVGHSCDADIEKGGVK